MDNIVQLRPEQKLFELINLCIRQNKISYEKWEEYYKLYQSLINNDKLSANFKKLISIAFMKIDVAYADNSQEEEIRKSKNEISISLFRINGKIINEQITENDIDYLLDLLREDIKTSELNYKEWNLLFSTYLKLMSEETIGEDVLDKFESILIDASVKTENEKQANKVQSDKNSIRSNTFKEPTKSFMPEDIIISTQKYREIAQTHIERLLIPLMSFIELKIIMQYNEWKEIANIFMCAFMTGKISKEYAKLYIELLKKISIVYMDSEEEIKERDQKLKGLLEILDKNIQFDDITYLINNEEITVNPNETQNNSNEVYDNKKNIEKYFDKVLLPLLEYIQLSERLSIQEWIIYLELFLSAERSKMSSDAFCAAAYDALGRSIITMRKEDQEIYITGLIKLDEAKKRIALRQIYNATKS